MSMVDSLDAHEQFASSDCKFLTFSLVFSAKRKQRKEFYNDCKRVNYVKMRNELNLVNWYQWLSDVNVESM